MPSPFPGMDPWLERPSVFPGLHNALVVYFQAALNKLLPPGYTAANDNRVYVDPELNRVPDVGVFGPDEEPHPDVAATSFAYAGLLAVAADPIAEPLVEPYLEIRSMDDERLVTAIEFVSPANKKPGDGGRTSYQQKQGEFRLSGVNLVEVDLLRGGKHATAVPEHRLRQKAGEFDYHVSVTVAAIPREFYVAAFRLADRLPTIPIPLDEGVSSVTIDLQTVFDRVYDEGAFAGRVKYDRRQPDPPLTPEQQAWAEGILRAKRLLK